MNLIWVGNILLTKWNNRYIMIIEKARPQTVHAQELSCFTTAVPEPEGRLLCVYSESYQKNDNN